MSDIKTFLYLISVICFMGLKGELIDKIVFWLLFVVAFGSVTFIVLHSFKIVRIA